MLIPQAHQPGHYRWVWSRPTHLPSRNGGRSYTEAAPERMSLALLVICLH